MTSSNIEVVNVNLKKFDEFIDYVFDNEWDYACAFAFKDLEIRNSKELVIIAWINFCKKIGKGNKDFKVIAFAESSRFGGYILHAFISNANLSLEPRRNVRTGEFLYSSFNRKQIFTCKEWQNGFNTICRLDGFDDLDYITAFLCKRCMDVDFFYIKEGGGNDSIR